MDEPALRVYLTEVRTRIRRLDLEAGRLLEELDSGLLDPAMLERRAVLVVGLGEHRRDDLALLQTPRTRVGRRLLWVAIWLGEVARWVG